MDRVKPERAVDLLLDAARPVAECVTVPLADARGRVAARDVFSPGECPPFDRSAMDGFAFDSRAAADRLEVVETLYAGDWRAEAVPFGKAVRIMTGAAVPGGCDCVVPKEGVSEEIVTTNPSTSSGHRDTKDTKVFVEINQGVRAGQFIVRCGEDVRAGALLVAAGTVLGAGAIGALAAVGIRDVCVFRLPKIALFTTGDELCPPGSELPPGKIYNSNEVMLATRLGELGFQPDIFPPLCDNTDAAVAFFQEKILNAGYDLVVTTGGVSVGDRDVMHDAFKRLGARILFTRLTSRPGGAMLAAVLNEDAPSPTLLFALSGNPFAAAVNFEVLGRPLLAKLCGNPSLAPRRVKARLTEALPNPGAAQHFVRARLENGVCSIPDNGAGGRFAAFARCNCIINIPAGCEGVPSGGEVEVLNV